jgi:hypothetical protein
LFESSVTTSKLKQITRDGLHNTPIVDHIIRKAKWTPQIFDSIHWDAYERAFQRLLRFYQYSTAKLCHGLVNTNRQNQLYYGQSPLCPICSQEEETLVHVFTCSHPSAMCHHKTRLAELCKDLDTAGTPLPVVQAVRHGFTKWDLDPLKTVRALTAGSLRGADAVLNTAFREQFTFIGWYHLCLGQISKKWALAVQHYVPPRAHTDGSLYWASIFIMALWKYSKALWAFQNEIVHGATVEEQVNQQLDTLQQQIINYYRAYADNPNMILPRHRSLFTSRTIEERLSSPYDIMAAWIRSVKEAIQVLQRHTASLRTAAQQIFPQQNEAADHESDSTYTSGSDESDVILSLALTETTAATTKSSSTNDSLISSSVTLLGNGDDSNSSYDDDALSLTSVPSTDTGSSNVEFKSVAFKDLDRYSATQEKEIPLTQITTSDSLQRPLFSNTASSLDDVEFPSVALKEQRKYSDQGSLGSSGYSNLSSFNRDGMGDWFRF